MPQYLPIIIDKSILQSITPSEAKWLFHHFRAVVPPVFFSELIGDLKKERSFSTGSADGDVRMLSSKMDSASIFLSAESSQIAISELRGHPVPMNGQVIAEAARRVQDSEGLWGVYLDQTPLQEVLTRWRKGDFKGMEAAYATFWRQHLTSIDLQSIIACTKELRVKSVNSSADVMRMVDRFLFAENQSHANLKKWIRIINVPKALVTPVLHYWKKLGHPLATEFAPYTAYLARLEMFFFLSISHHTITTRSSNQVDMEYIKYLPFTFAFASGDKLHRDFFSHFGRPDQVFLERVELKAALAEMVEYYDSLPDEVRKRGSYTYAQYPPVHMDNAVTKAFDMAIPAWREGANEPKPPISPEENARIMQHLRPRMAAMEAAMKATRQSPK